jgi:hypothetical protein
MKRLENLGVRFLRFTEQEVAADLQSMTDQIELWIKQQTTGAPTPNPSKEGNDERRISPPTEGSAVG